MDISSEAQMLKCPICELDFTHLQEVVVYQRPDGEDRQTVAVSVPTSGGAHMQLSNENPSARRDAVVLTFECEGGHQFKFTFAQHKGQTEVYSTNLE